MLRIHLEVAYHKLAIEPSVKLVQQKNRHYGLERLKMENVNVEKLLKVRFIKEVSHTTWLVDGLLEKKVNSNWKKCVDFIALNKAHPKDS